MIDFNKELVSALESVLPTHYEMALTSKTATPCISYMEIGNTEITEPIGSTVGYSRITYQVKVWSNKVADLQKYALQIDKVMKPLGFKRTSSAELYDNNSAMMQKILNYEALAIEQY